MAASTVRSYQHGPTEGEAIMVVTDRVRVLADAESTGGKLFIMESTTQPGDGPPLHRHSKEDEFFYILEGTFRFVRDGADIVVGPGSFVSAPKGSTHTFANAGTGTGRMLVICTPAGLERPFRESAVAAGKGPLTPEILGGIFAKHDLTFHGPPLGHR